MNNELCEVFTKNGRACPYLAKHYDAESGKITCGTHKPVCRALYEEYKNVCKNLECDSQMSKAELKSARKVLEECLKRRINFTYQCCNNLIDVGHAYMIVNLNRKLEDCDYFLYERKLRRKENRRVKDNN